MESTRRKFNFKRHHYKKRTTTKIFKTINIRDLSIRKPIILIEVVIIMYISLMLLYNNFKSNNLNIYNNSSNNLTSSRDLENLLKDNVLSSKDIELLNNNLEVQESFSPNILKYSEAELSNKNKILRDNYTIDEKTGIDMDLFDFNKFLNTDFSIKIENEHDPKILIFHTHGSEMYSDSNGLDEGVIGLGKLLEKEFEEVYGIPTLHITKRFDIVDGQTQILGAYERMNNYIGEVIEQYPSIEIVLDVHRDGLPEGVKRVTTVDGEATAPIMFVNGLTALKSGNSFEPIKDLTNTNLEENLAFSFKANTVGKSYYPTLFRKIYLHAYRYSLHFKGKSLLIEVGAQTNTWEESKNSVKPLAKTIVNVLK